MPLGTSHVRWSSCSSIRTWWGRREGSVLGCKKSVKGQIWPWPPRASLGRPCPSLMSTWTCALAFSLVVNSSKSASAPCFHVLCSPIPNLPLWPLWSESTGKRISSVPGDRDPPDPLHVAERAPQEGTRRGDVTAASSPTSWKGRLPRRRQQPSWTTSDGLPAWMWTARAG